MDEQSEKAVGSAQPRLEEADKERSEGRSKDWRDNVSWDQVELSRNGWY